MPAQPGGGTRGRGERLPLSEVVDAPGGTLSMFEMGTGFVKEGSRVSLPL
jgi:hypothetical protein